MNELEAKILINMGGNVPSQSKRFEQHIGRFADSGNRRLSIMKRTTASMGRQIDHLGNRYTAFATGIAGGTAIRFVANLDEQLRRMQTNANLTDQQMEKLKQTAFDVANAPELRVDVGQVVGAINDVLGLTGDLRFAQANIENMGLAMQGFGADGATAASLLAQFWEKGIRDPQEVERSLDRIFTQFGKGSLAASEIARVAPKLFSIVQQQGPEAVAEMGALAQLFVKTTGSADEAVTAIKAVYATFNDSKKLKILENSDIQVFVDAEKKILRPANELLREIVETADSNKGVLAKVFDQTALSGLSSLLTEENRNLLDELANGHLDVGRTQRAATKNAEGLNSALEGLHNILKRYADTTLAGGLQEVADFLNSLDPKTLDRAITAVLGVGGALATLSLGFKIADLGKRVGGIFSKGGKTTSGNTLTNAAGSLAPIPVFVVNNGIGLGKGKGGKPRVRVRAGVGAKGVAGSLAGKARGAAHASMNMLKNPVVLRAAGLAGLVGSAGAAGYSLGTVINKNLIEGTEFQEQLGRTIAKALAAMGNDNAQAALDSEERVKVELELKGEAASRLHVRDINGVGVELSGEIMSTL